MASAWPHDSPLVPRHGGLLEGDSSWAWLYLGGEIAALAAYGFGVLALRRGGRLATVAALAAAIQLAPLAAPLLISSDAWTYWDYGRIAVVHDANPYADPPSTFPRDPAYPHIGGAWRDATSVYGPLFTLASEPVSAAAGPSKDAAAWLFKGLAALFVLATVALCALIVPPGRRAFAVAFAGWNPLLALHFAGGGHNDAWMAAAVLGAVALGVRGRAQAAGVAWAAAVATKWSALVLLPLRWLEARARREAAGYAGFVVAGAAIALVATAQFGWRWLGTAGPLARNADKETRFALPHRLTELGVPHSLGLALAATFFAIAYLWLARQAWHGRARLAMAAALLLCATPYLVPWYLIWAVPLAAVEDDPPAQWLTVALSAYLLSQRVPL
jgi:Glycosyltransferase family 87